MKHSGSARRSRYAPLALGVVAALSLAACGGSSSTPAASASSSAAATSAAAPAISVAPTSAAATSAPASAAASSSAAASAVASSSAAAPTAAATVAAKVPCSATATKITMWGWAAGYDLAVAEFNKTHPDVCVTLQNNGAANDEYVKIGNTLKAGSGAPDVAEVEYFALPSFEITHSLADLTKYGVSAYKSKIAPVAWQQASQGSAVYAMPVDLGPLVQYYNSAQLTKAGITPPTTWAEFATAATKLHAADASQSIANFDPETAQDILALMQEDNAFPFTYTGGSTVGINFTGAAETAFANYWQKLLSSKAVTTVADFSPAQWTNLDNGANAVRFSPAWGPVGMQLNIKKTIGDWRAVAMPQAKAGDKLSGNWGGSTIAVLAGSKHAAAAAEFAEWFGGSDDAWKILSGPVAGAFPAYLPLLNDPSFQARTLPISGSAKTNSVFATAAQNMVASEWPPFMTAALTQWTTSFAGVAKGTETLPNAFKDYQAAPGEVREVAGLHRHHVLTPQHPTTDSSQRRGTVSTTQQGLLTQPSAGGHGPLPASTRRPRRRRGRLTGLWFVSPFVAILTLFMLVPIGYAIYSSLYTTKLIGGTSYSGLANYRTVLSSGEFWSGVERVTIFAIVQVPLTLGLALFFAVLFDAGISRFGRTLRVIYFMPFAVPAVVASVMWSFLLLPSLGPYTKLLGDIGLHHVNFFSSRMIIPTLVLIVVWEWTGYTMTILYTGAQGHPHQPDGGGDPRPARRSRRSCAGSRSRWSSRPWSC